MLLGHVPQYSKSNCMLRPLAQVIICNYYLRVSERGQQLSSWNGTIALVGFHAQSLKSSLQLPLFMTCICLQALTPLRICQTAKYRTTRRRMPHADHAALGTALIAFHPSHMKSWGSTQPHSRNLRPMRILLVFESLSARILRILE